MGIIVSACPTSEHVSVDAEHVSVGAEHVSADAEFASACAEHVSAGAEYVSVGAEYVSADAEHASTGAEHVSVDTEQACLSAGTVLASAIHAFGYLAINEESHSDTVMMSEWLFSFYMIRCINTLLRLRLQPPCSGLRGRCRRWCDSFLP